MNLDMNQAEILRFWVLVRAIDFESSIDLDYPQNPKPKFPFLFIGLTPNIPEIQ